MDTTTDISVESDATSADDHLSPPAGKARRADPPGPEDRQLGLPLLKAMKEDYLAFTKSLKDRYGDIVLTKLFKGRFYDVASIELVRALLVDNAANIIRWERGPEVFAELVGQSVLVTEGDVWQRQRRMLMPGFTPKRVAGYAGLMHSAVRDTLAETIPADREDTLVLMDSLFTRIAMDVILRTLFSSVGTRDSARAVEAINVLSATAMRQMFRPITLPDWLPLPGKAAKRHAMRTLKGIVADEIKARDAMAEADKTQGDVLAMLQGLRDEPTGASLSAQEVFDQCMVTFQAGHETSATALLWWSRLMAEHPQAAERAQVEVDTVLGERPLDPADIPSLPWLTATVKEAMRLYPPVAGLLMRRAMTDIKLGDWVIPRRSLVRVTPYIVHRDPRNFADPDAFIPERFLPEAPPVPRGAWFPFGLGPRVCVAQHFAMLEITLIASLLLQRFSFELPPDAPPRRAVLKVSLRPTDPVVLRLLRRVRGVSAAGAPRPHHVP